MSVLLEVDDLHVTYPGGVTALRGVSFTVSRGQRLAVVGESGSGKSTLARTLAGLVLPPQAQGRIAFEGADLLAATRGQREALRWSRIALGVQGAPFNPVTKIGVQVAEPLRVHRGLSNCAAQRIVRSLAADVHLDPATLDRFPAELSGGERQRALLAMVLTLEPDLVILDEPTTGQDAINRDLICSQITRLADTRGFALILVSHDLPAVLRLSTDVQVLYAGRIVEAGPTPAVLLAPEHPYTWALVGASPVMATTKDLRPIRGAPPDSRSLPTGCAFHPRCTQAVGTCSQQDAELAPVRDRDLACHLGGLQLLLAGRGLTKRFTAGRRTVTALDHVEVTVREGEALGVIGASGSGKSTLARLLAGDLQPDAGDVWFQGRPLPRSWSAQDRLRRRRVQLVLQDPADALSPRLPVRQLLWEPLQLGDPQPAPAAGEERICSALTDVGLPTGPQFLSAAIHELSGGQRQRLAVARALLADPKVLIADEPTAMLDGSEQARLLLLLRQLQVERGMGMVLVSHDLAVVRKVTDRIVILHAGRIIESGPSHQIMTAPCHELTRRLVDAAVGLDRIRAPLGTTITALSTGEGDACDVG